MTDMMPPPYNPSPAPRCIGCSSFLPARRIVGWLDFLGFKKDIRARQINELNRQYRNWLHRVFTSIRHQPVRSFSVVEGRPSWETDNVVPGCAIFSDSILLWADDNESNFTDFIGAVHHLVVSLLNRDPPLLVRGGIALGDCVIDLPNGVVLGSAILDAIETENSQCWVGVALHPTVEMDPKVAAWMRTSSYELIEYNAIPVKTNSGLRLRYAFNWPAFIDPDPVSGGLPKQLMNRISIRGGRLSNTERFFRHCWSI